MATLPCPRCGQPRSAHTPCPHCGAPGLTTDIPPLPDVAIPDEAPSSTVPALAAAERPFAPSVVHRQPSDAMGRVGYLVAAVLSAIALVFFYGALWGGDNDAPPETPTEEVFDVPPPEPPDAPLPPEPPAVPELSDTPRPPGMSDSDWEEMQRDLREAQRDVEQAAREAQREIEQAAREAEREARRAAEEARRR